jgi:hypothetical protein
LAEGGFVCPECGLKVGSSQALGSHIKFKHGGGSGSSSAGESLDFRRDFVGLLEDVGVKRGTKTISDIFFESGADSLDNLDRVLRLSGITNPARGLILRRWGQRVNREVPEGLLSGKESEERKGDVWDAYNKLRESELTELLMSDLRSRIMERRRQSGGVDETKNLVDKIEKLERGLTDLESVQNAAARHEQRQMLMPPDLPRQRRSEHHTHPCDDPTHSLSCVVCGRCGFHGTIGRISIGGYFNCPECGATYFRDH